MPVITIRNGTRTVKLSKRERDTLSAAQGICKDLQRDYPPAVESATAAAEHLGAVLKVASETNQ